MKAVAQDDLEIGHRYRFWYSVEDRVGRQCRYKVEGIFEGMEIYRHTLWFRFREDSGICLPWDYGCFDKIVKAE